MELRRAEFSAKEPAAKPLTVLELAPPPGHGGAERALHETAAALGRTGARVVIAAPEVAASLRLRATGARLVALDLDTRSPLRIRTIARTLAAIVRSEGVDLIHARSPAAAAAGARAAAETGAGFVTTWTGGDEDEGLLTRPLFDALASGRPVIATSDYAAETLCAQRGVAPERIVTIPRGADMAIFAQESVSPGRASRMAQLLNLVEDHRPLILSPGRIAPGTGRTGLIGALAVLKAARGPDFTCIFAGVKDAEYAAELEAEIAALGVGDVARLSGPVADMPAALMLAAVVATPASRPQLSTRLLIEAQAMGRPVVAADHGAAREVVRHNASGWLTPPGDTPALAAALGAALDLDESGRAHLGLAGRALVRSRFTLAATLAATLQVYEAAATRAAYRA